MSLGIAPLKQSQKIRINDKEKKGTSKGNLYIHCKIYAQETTSTPSHNVSSSCIVRTKRAPSHYRPPRRVLVHINCSSEEKYYTLSIEVAAIAQRESLELAGVCVIGRPDHCLDQSLAHDIQVLFGDPLVHHRVVTSLLRRGFQFNRKVSN